jgi:hypothetical protein
MTDRRDHPRVPEDQLIIDNIALAYVDQSPIHEFGLFAAADIEKGTLLGTLDGQVMAWDQYDRIVAHLKNTLSPSAPRLFMEWNALSKTTLLVRPFRTKYSFINHSRTPNLELRRDPLSVVSLCRIEKNEELLLDYREEPLRDSYLEGHGRTFL